MNPSKNRVNNISAIIVFLIGMFFTVSIVGAFTLFGNNLTRENGQGAVRVSATYLSSQGTVNEKIALRLTFDTHSVDLSQYDFKKISFIQIDDQKPQPGESWDFTGAGHHFKGIITFDQTLPVGTQKVRLLIRGLDGVEERIFEWQMPIV